MTNNLSEVLEALVADYLFKERARRDAQAKALKEAILTWNTFAENRGSFGDEHSTL